MRLPHILNSFIRPRHTQVLAFALALITLLVSFAGGHVQAGRWLSGGKAALTAKVNARPASPVREEIARKLKTQAKVKVELFVMSQCPFGVRAEEALAPVLDEFGEQVDFQLRFIATPSGEGFASLHGQPEVDENIRQVVMAEQFPEQYFEYVVARAANYRSNDWQPVAAAAGIDVKMVDRLARSEAGKRLFAENIRRGNELRVNASPTIFLDGMKYQGRVLPPAPTTATAKTAGATMPPGIMRLLPVQPAGAWSISAWQKWFSVLGTQASAAVQSGINRVALTSAQLLDNSRDWFAGSNLTAAVSVPSDPVITATKAFTLQNTGCPGNGTFDLNCNGFVNPGDRLMYSVLLNNSGNADALNVVFTDVLNANLTFSPDSLSASPIAQNERYNTANRKPLQVAAEQTINGATFVMGSVRDNDIDPLGGTLTITPLTNSPTTQGGSVTLSDTGTFLYTPLNNFSGSDTFIYAVTTAQGKSDTATVTIVVAQPTCTDMVKNGSETDIDCGGATCAKCEIGQICTSDSDCTSQNCSGGSCQAPRPVCGNGSREGTEACDDGNTANGDGCSASCVVEPGYTCTGSPSVCSAGCGDGIKAGNEQCDDGNRTNGDGCSSTCTSESGWTCTGAPSVCTLTCSSGFVNCGGTCVNLSMDVNNCGVCGANCYSGAVQSNWQCINSACVFTGCQLGYYDLNGDHKCEYRCNFTSLTESCNGLDDNCNGQIDENVSLGQTPGDCKTNVCSGGGVASAPDNSDVPVDGNQCTLDVCTNGVPSNPAAPAGTSCNQNGGSVCDGAGACITAPIGSCANPKLVPNTGEYSDSGSTVGAANGADPPCGAGNALDKIYAVTPTSNRTITANTNGSSFDTVMFVTQGSCTGPAVVCDDDSGNGTQSQVSWNATAGVTYFVIVDGYNGATGNYVLNFSGLDLALNSASSPQQNQLSQVPSRESAGPLPTGYAASLGTRLQQWLRPLFSAFATPLSYFNLSRRENWMHSTVQAAEHELKQPANVIEAPSSAGRSTPTRTLLINSKGESTIVPTAAIPMSFAGETIMVKGNGSGFTLPAGKSTTIMFNATISNSFTGTTISNQASVFGRNFASLTSNNLTTQVLQPPVISSNTLPVKAGSSAGSFTIATAFDPDQAAHTLGITINGNPTVASSNGVMVSDLAITPSGTVTAKIATTCAATSATFNLVVTDSQSALGTGTLSVTVTPNMPPLLSYNPAAVTIGTTPLINPATGPSDNGTINALVLQSVVPNNGGLTVSVNAAGQVQVLSATLAGSFTVNLAVTDACNATAFVPLTINVGCPTSTFNPATLPNGVQGTLYTQTLTVTPAGGNYSYVLATGALPPGLLLASNGTLSGTPTAGGNYAFAVKATGWGTCAKTQSYNLLVTGTCAALTLDPATLPSATLGTMYNQSLTVNPAGTYTFAVTQGALPNGLTLVANTGVLSGMPTTGGTFSFRIAATHVGGCTGSRNYVMTVSCGTLNFTPPTLPNGTRGAAYSQQLAVNSAGNATFSLLLGSLPPGFTLSSAGLLSGTTAQAGTYNFTAKALAGSCQGTKAYALVIGGGTAALALSGDYDGDGVSDLTLWSAAGGVWRIIKSSNGQAVNQSWGTTGDVTLLGDYDGDGKSDLAVFRPADATFYVKRSRDGGYFAKAWGVATDVPVPGDYDGDGQTDIAVWRGTTGTWYIVRSSDGQFDVQTWGSASAPYHDVPVAGDYDGDGKTDIAVFRRGNGTWLVKRSSDGQYVVKLWGLGTDVPVAQDYDGDGKTDIAVWRSGWWYIWQSATNAYRVTEWGTVGDRAAAGDYDGDGQADVAVWRTTEQTWYIRESGTQRTRMRVQGKTADVPVSVNVR